MTDVLCVSRLEFHFFLPHTLLLTSFRVVNLCVTCHVIGEHLSFVINWPWDLISILFLQLWLTFPLLLGLNHYSLPDLLVTIDSDFISKLKLFLLPDFSVVGCIEHNLGFDDRWAEICREHNLGF